MQWAALATLLIFLFLSFVLPVVIGAIIVVRDATDDQFAERDYRFRQFVMGHYEPSMAAATVVGSRVPCGSWGSAAPSRPAEEDDA